MARRIKGFGLPPNLLEAAEYALLMGGKRSRPVLAIESCRAIGGAREAAYPAAMAIELIHAFSLVHDDLPAMDDDDLRRGRPTTHVKYGEAMAILAGDCMMSLAFQLLTTDVPAPASARLSRELAEGTTAMIAGQVYDTLGGLDPSLDDAGRLEAIHSNKTGALLRAACRMGAISAGATDAQLASLTRYGGAIGLMFQIVDDLLDIEQTAEHTGKRTRKDQDAGKLTYPGVHGADASRSTITRLRAEALEALRPLGPPADPLRELCEWLSVRTR
jgi:geranylgeranyl diphosphate synthase type II